MTVLLARDTLTLSRPSRTLDEHGWATVYPAAIIGTVTGSVQEQVPTFDAGVATAGPHDPDTRRRATIYLNDAVEPGDRLSDGSVRWLVETVNKSQDPRGTGMLDCWIATCVEDTIPGEPIPEVTP